MSSGLFAASMLLAALLLVCMDVSLAGQVPASWQPGLAAAAGFDKEMFSLAFGKVVVYFILTAAIYLFLRGVRKSFSPGAGRVPGV